MIRSDSLGPLRVAVRTVLARSHDLLPLEDQLRRSLGSHPLTGCGPLAAEVAFHLLGGPDGPWRVHSVRHEGRRHWFLACSGSGAVLDLAADQFGTPVPYADGGPPLSLPPEPGPAASEVLRRLAVLPASCRDSSSPGTRRCGWWRRGAPGDAPKRQGPEGGPEPGPGAA